MPALVIFLLFSQGAFLPGQRALPGVRAEASRQGANDASDGIHISGPVLGYIYDPALAQIRPIFGIPGAATMGAPLGFGLNLARAAVSPQHDYALVEPDGNPGLAVLRLPPATSVPRLIPDAMAGAERVIFSPTGNSVILYDAIKQKVQIITGLPGAPSVAGEVDVSTVGGPITALAVSDDAAAILAGVSQDGAGALWLLSPGGHVHVVFPAGNPSAVAFLRNSHDAVMADGTLNTVYFLRDVTGAGEPVFLAGKGEGISGPVAVAVSDDNRQILIANSQPGSVAQVDLSSGTLTLVPCDCAVVGLQRLNGNAVFRVMEASDGLVRLFDGDAAEPRILLVPADARSGADLELPAHRGAL